MNREQRRALAKKISNKSIRSALRNKGLINRLEDKVCHVRIIDEEKTKMGVYGIYEDEMPYFHIKELLLKEDKDEQETETIV